VSLYPAWFESDFIPKGGTVVNMEELEFRKVEDYEYYQCCRITGRDPQSGPFYCGALAKYVAFHEDGVRSTALCERHKPPTHQIKQTED